MLEVEAKFRCPDHTALAARLANLGAVEIGLRSDEDHYFNAPDRDFARTDEALRLRRIGEENFVTYKGPRIDAQTKTRKEIEIPIARGSEAAEHFCQLLMDLGYRPTAVVRKQRRLFHVERDHQTVEVCVDRVDGVGDYAELEIQAPEDSLAEARSAVLETATKLGLVEAERRSYLELLLSSRAPGQIGDPPYSRIVRTLEETRTALDPARRAGKRIGLVPTMGALHDGHLSLIREARRETEFVVVTIFVNPAQFGPNEDLARYPRPLDRDIAQCTAERVDLVIVPEVTTIYPPDYRTYVEVHGLSDVLEGASRPGHFRGVATVVLKLFNIVQPYRAYFGQKDAQQVCVIGQMVRDLNVPVEIRVCPTVREPDGLAISSRNQYLSADERRGAVCLFQALEQTRRRVERGERDAAALCASMAATIQSAGGAQLDYAVIIDANTLQPIGQVKGRVLAAVAARFGQTRLIDNIALSLE